MPDTLETIRRKLRFRSLRRGTKESDLVIGGFAIAHWNGDPEIEKKINDDLAVTIRCIPNEGEVDGADEPGTCPFTGEPSQRKVVWAKSY